MSKHSNYNLLRLQIDDKDVTPQEAVRNINRQLPPEFKIDKRFRFRLSRSPGLSLLTFNINKYCRKQIRNSSKIFRKKDYNVFYQINTLPKIIKHQNGKYQNDFIIDWSQFRNTLIVSNGQGIWVKPLQFQGYVFINQDGGRK